MSQSKGFDVPLYANRRENARYGSTGEKPECPVRDEEGKEHQASVLDISAGGVGLLMERRLAIGTFLSIVLPTRHEAGSHKFTVRVQKCEEGPLGKWRVGCAFAHPLSDSDLLLLL